jgi:hypothetical protein
LPLAVAYISWVVCHADCVCCYSQLAQTPAFSNGLFSTFPHNGVPKNCF